MHAKNGRLQDGSCYSGKDLKSSNCCLNPQIFQKSRQEPLQNFKRQNGDTGGKYHNLGPQILGATVQNLVDTTIWRPGFVHASFDRNTIRIFVWRVKVNKKSKVIPLHVTKAHREGGSRGIAKLILNLGTRCSWVVNFTLRPIFTWERTPQAAVWVRPCRDSHPGSIQHSSSVTILTELFQLQFV